MTILKNKNFAYACKFINLNIFSLIILVFPYFKVKKKRKNKKIMFTCKTPIHLKMFLEQFSVDFFLFLKLFFYNIYCYIEAIYKKIIPLSYASKDVEGEIVLVTGAGNSILY